MPSISPPALLSWLPDGGDYHPRSREASKTRCTPRVRSAPLTSVVTPVKYLIPARPVGLYERILSTDRSLSRCREVHAILLVLQH